MKAFEEWDKKLCKVDCPIAEIKEISCDSCTSIRRIAWKEALKWVLNHPETTNEIIQDYSMGFIREELKD